VAFLQRTGVTSVFPLVAAVHVAVATASCGGKGADGPHGADPERQSDAEYDVARDYFEKNQPRSALDHIRRAIELNEDNGKALLFASLVHLSFCATVRGFEDPDCRLSDAEAFARRALKVQENFREARNTLGQILINEKKYAEAVTVLEPLTKDPAFDSPYLAWGNFGWAQVMAGQVDAGIQSLKNSITQPLFCVGHYRLGVAYEKKGDFAAAETSLTNALSVDKDDCRNLQDAWLERGRVRIKLGKSADAKADFEKCRGISAETSSGKSCDQALKML
jgi:Tfp pilus assembly protein PilF